MLRFGAALLAASSLMACQGKVSDDSISYLRAGDLAQRIERSPEKNLVIDARSPEEFAAGHIPGARHMSLTDFDPDKPDPELARYSAIIVYGENPASGVARAMTKRLLAARLTDVYLLEGGMAAWRSSGAPVATSGALR